MKLFVCLLLVSVSLFGAEPKKKTTTKKAPAVKVEEYDPDKLPSYERACGRLGAKNNHPCQCMKHRVAEADKAREKCYAIVDRNERIACAQKADPCAVKVTDAESAAWSAFDDSGVPMPAQCSRSCTKAKCECCHS